MPCNTVACWFESRKGPAQAASTCVQAARPARFSGSTAPALVVPAVRTRQASAQSVGMTSGSNRPCPSVATDVYSSPSRCAALAMERCDSSDANTRRIPRTSRAAQIAVRLAAVAPGVMCPPSIPKYGASQFTTRASTSRATGATSGCSRFWLSAAFQSVVAHEIHGVGGSMCARACGALSRRAPPNTSGASRSSVAVSPNPDSGSPKGRESTDSALAGGVDRSSFKACSSPVRSAEKEGSFPSGGGGDKSIWR